MDYAPCAELQRRVIAAVAEDRLPDSLLFVEHEPVLTLGASFQESNLRRPREEYEDLGIRVLYTDRGGDVTYHGPNQLVIYPIFDVARHGRDLHKWLRDLEEAVILALREFGIEAFRFSPHTGVWGNVEGLVSSVATQGVGPLLRTPPGQGEPPDPPSLAPSPHSTFHTPHFPQAAPHSTPHTRKIAAIGIKVRRWVSMHGIALNCSNDLSPFDLIVPCGIEVYGVTSITELVGRPVPPDEAKRVVATAFESVFGLKFEQKTRAWLEANLG